jgi:hypothetical protein
MKRTTDTRLRAYLNRIDAPFRSRSVLAEHHEAVAAILSAGHTLITVHRYLTRELGIDVAYSSLTAYVRRHGVGRSPPAGAAQSADPSPPSSTTTTSIRPQFAPAAGSVRTSSGVPTGPHLTEPVDIPVTGTSDWSVLSSVTRNAEHEFRQLGEAARRRRRQQRGFL